MDHLDPPAAAEIGDSTPTRRFRTRTLKDVLEAVSKAPNVKEARRREMLSGIRAVGRCLNRELSDIRAQPSALQAELKNANYVLAGFSPDRWTQIRSLMLRALRIAGMDILPSRWSRSEFTREWEAIRLTCPSEKYRVGLSRFMNFCSSRGIGPQDVNMSTWESFRVALEQNSLVRNSAGVYRQSCRLWDKASDEIGGWPDFKVRLPTHDQEYSLEWSAFSDAFNSDVEAFLSAKANDDYFSDNYAPAVRPATTLNRRKQIRQMATALAFSGVDPDAITGLIDLVRPENAKDILQFFLARNDGKKKESIYAYATLIRTIARHWANVGPEAIGKLDKFCRNLSIKQSGMTARNRERLRQFDDPRNVDAILGLPVKLTRLAARQDTGTEAGVGYAMYAIAIELLTMAPVRNKNLVSLDIEKNLIITGTPQKPRVAITIPREDVKNSVNIDFALPEESSALVMQYIRDYRPRISSEHSTWLFPNFNGDRRNIVSFGAQLSSIIKSQSGLIMHPHLFRHLAVKFVLSEDPNAIETARLLLGHTSGATTRSSYAEGNTDAAHRDYETMIQNMRDGTRRQKEGARARRTK